MSFPPDLRAEAARIRLVGLDVDGVLTDGSLTYGPDGEVLKTFHVHDGLGIKLLLDEGIAVVVITARRSLALERRLAELGVSDAYLGEKDKGARVAAVLAQRGIARAEAAFVGDDLPDLAAMARVGLPIAVADAHERVRASVRWVTRRSGGKGAVREVADALLEARGRLDAAVERYRAGASKAM